VAGIEFQGLTGVAAISLVGGAPSAPPVPLDSDGIPVLTADLSDAESIVDTLHSVDRTIVSNAPAIKEGLRTFEDYTADLRSKGDDIDSVMAKVDSAFAGFDKAVTKIEGVVPGFADGKADELFEKLKSLRELADTYKQKSATFLEEGRRMLSDVSEGANNFARKIDPQSVPTPAPAAARRAAPKRP
jgi:phospholipid/cholesterol/gamma-HCH transport system substrate-binding protein